MTMLTITTKAKRYSKLTPRNGLTNYFKTDMV